MIVELIEVIPFLQVIDLWKWLLNVLWQNGSERKSWWYVNFHASTEGVDIFTGLVIYILFAKYIDVRFYRCFDYVYKHSWKMFVYTTHPTVVPSTTLDIISFNEIFTISLLAGFVKLMMYLKICPWILKQFFRMAEFCSLF